MAIDITEGLQDANEFACYGSLKSKVNVSLNGGGIGK